MQNNLHHIIYGNEDPLEEHYINAFLGQLLRGLEVSAVIQKESYSWIQLFFSYSSWSYIDNTNQIASFFCFERKPKVYFTNVNIWLHALPQATAPILSSRELGGVGEKTEWKIDEWRLNYLAPCRKKLETRYGNIRTIGAIIK